MTFTFAMTTAVPGAGDARVDLWHGDTGSIAIDATTVATISFEFVPGKVLPQLRKGDAAYGAMYSIRKTM